MPYPSAVLEIAAQVRNWGRWGEDDQIGTLNFITDEVVRAAARLVRRGARFSLAYPLQLSGLQTGAIPGRVNPLRTMVAMWARSRVKRIAGVPSDSRRLVTFVSAAGERLAGATGSRSRAASGPASSMNVSGAHASIMCHCT